MLRDEEGWQITPSGRDFLRALEAVSQDNHAIDPEPLPHAEAGGRRRGALIVVGDQFKNRVRRDRDPAPQRDERQLARFERVGVLRAFSSEVDTGSREENASKQKHRAPFRFNRNGKGSSPKPAREFFPGS